MLCYERMNRMIIYKNKSFGGANMLTVAEFVKISIIAVLAAAIVIEAIRGGGKDGEA